jgi:hypothetical protein
MVACGLHTAGQGGIARREQRPAVWCGQDFAIGCTDGVGGRAWGEGCVFFHDERISCWACANQPKDSSPSLRHQTRILKAPIFRGRPERMKKVDILFCLRKNWYCSLIMLRAYSPATKGLAARCLAFLAPLLFFLFVSWMRHPHQGERNVLKTLLASLKGYRTMLALHDQLPHHMRDRLQTTCMGLGLVRLLQDAQRFEEATTTLCLLENGIQGMEAHKPSQQPSQANQWKDIIKTASCSSASASPRIDAAEMRPQAWSLA